MSEIAIENMSFYAFVGCFEEERKVGTNFNVSLYLTCDTAEAEQTDDLNDTIDYSAVYQVVKREMAVSSHLVEHVARRIIDAVKKEFPTIEKIRITVTKLNPPIGGQVGGMSLTIQD